MRVHPIFLLVLLVQYFQRHRVGQKVKKFDLVEALWFKLLEFIFLIKVISIEALSNQICHQILLEL